MDETIQFKLNGKSVSVTTDSDRKLLWVLRSDLGMTGAKAGCLQGYCGACSVLINGEPAHACQTSVKEVQRAEVTTIEGLAGDGALHPVQQAFVDHDAMQCGFCTPGMIVQAAGLLRKNPQPSRAAILESMDRVYCRCGAHTRIVQAVQSAAAAINGGKKS
jgi:aerobic-type carbon monoxide dehydrogenase small subunit (CoxS/CutS family)